MANTKLFLSVDASNVDVKQLLQKDFLELSMRAVSSANPNRNNSWFTKESMERSIETFTNKPILGYFENGDFVSHNGEWRQDSETEMSYWDTLGSKGERILGMIRESDEIKIVEDSSGLSWITFTCVLWTQYSYKQVKRLIKDAKRAQKTGEATKNISVEVDITDYEILENGVMKINAFNLVGVTILGTRNGIKVEPGIEDAELSVIDVMGRDIYNSQTQSLRLAYERLNKIEQQEDSQMENEKVQEAFEEIPAAEEQEVQSEKCEEGEVCPDCGKNPCECENAHCESGEESEDGKKSVEEQEAAREEEPENKDEPVEEQESCGGCAEKCESEMEEKYNALLSEKEQLEAKFNEMNTKYEELQEKVSKFEHENFMKEVDSLIQKAGLSEDIAADFSKQCEENTISSIDDLKVKVALYKFDNGVEEDQGEAKAESFEAPVVSPDITAAFEQNDDKKKKNKKDHWSSLREYVGK